MKLVLNHNAAADHAEHAHVVARGEQRLRQTVYGVSRQLLPSYTSAPCWCQHALPWPDGSLSVSHQGFDLLVAISSPGQFDEHLLVRLRFDTYRDEPWWHVDGDHLRSITVRLLQEQADKWPIPENWRAYFDKDAHNGTFAPTST